jgi:hypothetical protein
LSGTYRCSGCESACGVADYAGHRGRHAAFVTLGGHNFSGSSDYSRETARLYLFHFYTACLCLCGSKYHDAFMRIFVMTFFACFCRMVMSFVLMVMVVFMVVVVGAGCRYGGQYRYHYIHRLSNVSHKDLFFTYYAIVCV